MFDVSNSALKKIKEVSQKNKKRNSLEFLLMEVVVKVSHINLILMILLKPTTE